MRVLVTLADEGETLRFDATRVSTDEHNNLELWSGRDADRLLYLCASQSWSDVTIDDEGE